MPGLYDDLGPGKYHDKKFKTLLIKVIKELQKKDPKSCFRLKSN